MTDINPPTQKTLTFLHTSPTHVARFDKLLSELFPNYADRLQIRHMVNENLLPSDGVLTDELKRQTMSILMQLSSSSDLTICTCSTIGPIADMVGNMVDADIMRIDRPMASLALAHGDKILIAACLASTIGPTQKLVLDAAEETNTIPMLMPLLIEDAWQHFEADNQAAYGEAIGNAVTQALANGSYDAVLLAQASMDVALPHLSDCDTPVYCSPPAGISEALKRLDLL